MSSTTYTVISIGFVTFDDPTAGLVTVWLSSPIDAGWTFTIDGETFAVSDATRNSEYTCCGGYLAIWDSNAFRDWTEGQRIAVDLTVIRAAPEGPEEPEEPEAQVPGVPTDVVVEADDMMLTVTWDKPDNRGSSPVTGYSVQFRQAGGVWADHAHDGLTRETTIDGLVNGVAYRVRVAAMNDAGMGPYAEPKSGTPWKPEEEVPTPALPFFGSVALASVLAAVGRRRMRQQTR
ncbi:MAG: fibronectin type III domain-containing protein [Gammaproteobacteria bacterium]|nr:fibronectin type III domain-containing protein [Gammaproteobacteria bacterium]